MTKYDLIVIGAGWAGFNAALEARKFGKSVCLIDKSDLGGTCLNRGCIPAKALIQFAKGGLTDLELFQVEKLSLVKKLRDGIEFMLKAQKVDFIAGEAKIVSPNKVMVGDGSQEIDGDFILIATGSQPKELPFLKIDHDRIISSDDILKLNKLPSALLIIGGGVIGCEFASVFAKMGTKVTIVEIQDRLISMFDPDITSRMTQTLKKLGVDVKTKCDVKNEDLGSYEKILMGVGRQIDLSGLLDSSLSLVLNESGGIQVNSNLKTSIHNIYAAGDCIGGMQLAHTASYEARIAVDSMFSDKRQADYSAVPASVFTTPGVAQVGMNEQDAKKASRKIKVIKKVFSSIGMSYIIKETEGFIKLIIDDSTLTVIGAGIIGPQATELINTLALAVNLKATKKNLRDTIFAHPSISEILIEAVHS